MKLNFLFFQKGLLSNNANDESSILFNVELNILDNLACSVYSNTQNYSSEICSGYLPGGKGICHGKSFINIFTIIETNRLKFLR